MTEDEEKRLYTGISSASTSENHKCLERSMNQINSPPLYIDTRKNEKYASAVRSTKSVFF